MPVQQTARATCPAMVPLLVHCPCGHLLCDELRSDTRWTFRCTRCGQEGTVRWSEGWAAMDLASTPQGE